MVAANSREDHQGLTLHSNNALGHCEVAASGRDRDGHHCDHVGTVGIHTGKYLHALPEISILDEVFSLYLHISSAFHLWWLVVKFASISYELTSSHKEG